MSNKHCNDPCDYRDEPTYWFAVLEIARERGDFEGAAGAKHELQRLGIHVAYDRPQTRKGGGQ